MVKTKHITKIGLHRQIQSLEREIDKIENEMNKAKEKSFSISLLLAIKKKDIDKMNLLKEDFEREFKKSYRKYSKSMRYL